MANPTLVVSSRDDDFLYYDNLAYLRKGVKEEKIQFVDYADVHEPPEIPFEVKRTYDFTRTAKAKIREKMTSHLMDVLNPPATLKEQFRAQLRTAFDCLYDYRAYKGSVDKVGQQRHESLYMLIFFNHEDRQFVANVTLSSITARSDDNQYTVNVALVCQRFSYFPLQETDIQQLVETLKRLRKNEDGEPQARV